MTFSKKWRLERVIDKLNEVLGGGSANQVLSKGSANDLDVSWTTPGAVSEVNDLSASVTWANVPDANITQSSVTQHVAAIDHDSLLNFASNEHFTQAAISITESQISDLQSYLTAETNDLSAAVTWANVPDANVPESAVTQHEAALSVVAANIDAEASTDGWVLTSDGASGAAWEAAPGGGGAVDTSGTPVLNDIARFTDADTIEGRSYAELKADLDLEIGTDVQAWSAVLDATTASFLTADETKLDGIEALADVTSTAETSHADVVVDADIGSTVQAWSAVLDATTASFLTADETKLDAIEALADVTDTANVTSAGALMDSEVDADIKTLVLPASTTISAFGASLIDDAAASNARTTLDVDQAGTDNSTDVTLAGQDYLTLSTQQITANKLNVDDLADGTDGELITWSAAGVATTVAVGTSGHVLTSGGAGVAPTFQAAGGGGGTPTENVILTATKTSGQNINGVEGTETDLTWDVVAQDTGELTSFSSGDANVIFTNAGWVNIHASAYISNGLMNNRTMISLSLYHFNSGDTLQYSYHGDMQYNRDDNAAYDSSGGSVSQNMMLVAAGDYIYIRTRIFDDGTSGTSQPLDTTYSKLRIAQIVF